MIKIDSIRIKIGKMILGLLIGFVGVIISWIIIIGLESSSNLLTQLPPPFGFNSGLLLGVVLGVVFLSLKLNDSILGKIIYIVLWIFLASPLIGFVSLLPIIYMLQAFS